ncbi:MAG: hypothetical protein HY349_08105 [Nitrospirae bacterium]|nr:hypothetical protein [Nitrospirota bacterium]
MYRVLAFFASGLVSFLLVGTVVAQQIASSSLETQPVAGERVKAAAVRHMSGTVKGIDLVAQTLSVKNRKGEQNFVITPETQVKKGRAKLKLADLKSDSKVTVTYWDREGTKQASVVKVKK